MPGEDYGLTFALLSSAYGFKPWEIEQMTLDQIGMYMEHLPLVEMRKHYPIAQLEASIKNMMGGKPDGSDEGKSIPPERLYNALELLPWYARPEGVEASVTIPVQAARDFLGNLKDVPSWVIEIAPLEAIKRAAD